MMTLAQSQCYYPKSNGTTTKILPSRFSNIYSMASSVSRNTTNRRLKCCKIRRKKIIWASKTMLFWVGFLMLARRSFKFGTIKQITMCGKGYWTLGLNVVNRGFSIGSISKVTYMKRLMRKTRTTYRNHPETPLRRATRSRKKDEEKEK